MPIVVILATQSLPHGRGDMQKPVALVLAARILAMRPWPSGERQMAVVVVMLSLDNRAHPERRKAS